MGEYGVFLVVSNEDDSSYELEIRIRDNVDGRDVNHAFSKLDDGNQTDRITEAGDYTVSISIYQNERTVDHRDAEWSIEDTCDLRHVEVRNGTISEMGPLGRPG